ncbi:restriction endonuclease subunit S [Nitrosopumilus sp.]|nr:restriction endonuclease subunit S [Nitrosopumilus sp.]
MVNQKNRELYKQTELGLIPKEWTIKRIKEITKVSVGLVINPSTYFDKNGTVPMITGKNVTEKGIVLDDVDFISEKSNRFLETTRIWSGDLVTMRVGYPGRTSVVKKELDGINCASVIITRKNKKILSAFLGYLINSELISKQIIRNQVGGAQKVVNIGSWKEFFIVLPPIPEQEIIVQYITTIDELINSLESIIQKKKNIKQGAMQELLTGEKRLEGFNGKWTIQSFKKLGQLDSESLSNNTKKDYEFNYISIENVDRGVLKGWIKLKFKNAPSRARKIIRYQDILISTVRPNSKSHLMIKINEPDFICSTGFSVLRCDEKIDPRYVYFHLFANFIDTQINDIISGSNYPSINKKDVEKLEIPIPSDKREQIAISNTLSDMDLEIQELETKRDKYFMIKNGMMQKLLTGEIRLT